MKDRYFFARSLTRELDYFAFPRTGSHFLRYCTQGLFDLVALAGPVADNAEAIERQRELDPEILYALDLREDGVPYQPVFLNSMAAGVHGRPVKGRHPVVMLIRDPIATVYSFYRVAVRRWGRVQETADPARWVTQRLASYHAFYTAAVDVLNEYPEESILIRFEDLVESPAPLERLVRFVGVRPKLRPSFVHCITRFDRMTSPGERTFYSAGDNGAWRRDEEWCTIMRAVTVPDCSRFGYSPSLEGIGA